MLKTQIWPCNTMLTITKCIRQRKGPWNSIGRRMKARGQRALSWYSNNFLLATPDKFQPLYINPWREGQERQNAEHKWSRHCERRTHYVKLLGVHIDDNLNLAEYISKLCTKASQKVGALSPLRNLISFYCTDKSLILPLTYCYLTWHFRKSSDERKLQRMQEQALRVQWYIISW